MNIDFETYFYINFFPREYPILGHIYSNGGLIWIPQRTDFNN